MLNDQNYAYTAHPVAESDDSNLRVLLGKCLKKWPWFVLSVGLMVLAAHVYLLRQQSIYRIQASILVQDQQKGGEQISSLKELGVVTPNQVVENEIEILHSFTLMNRVVEKLNLDVRYFQATTFSEKELYNESPVKVIIEEANPKLYTSRLDLLVGSNNTVKINERIYPLNQTIETPYGRLKVLTRKQGSRDINTLFVKVSKRSSTVKNYLANLRATPSGKGSTIISLSLEDGSPTKGEDVLNQLIKEYNQAAVMDRNAIAATTLNLIEDRLKLISGELSAVEKNVESYKSSHGITDLSVQAQSFLQTVQQNDAHLNQVNVQLAALNDLQSYVKSTTNNRSSTPAIVGLNDPVLLQLINDLTELERRRDQLAHTTSEQSPLVEALDSQIKTAKNNMAGNIATMKTMLVSTRQQYLAQNGEVEGAIRMIPQKERLLTNITRQQAIKNSLFTYLLQKREETAVAFASAITGTRTVDSALSDDQPIKPVKSTIYALFCLLGLILPVAVIAGSDALNNRVTRRVDVEEVTQIPILGELVKKRQTGPLVITPNSQSIIAEQIRTLRACLPFLRNESTESQVLLFTSSISGEGKSFVSVNLGMSLAYVDKPTVILDMDLRMPKLHKMFNVSNEVGISDYLKGKSTLDDILAPVPGTENYFVIPSGSIPKNPSELLSSPRLNELIEELRKRFDYILIDTPPVGLVSDARMIAPLADATLFMVRHNMTPKNHLRIVDKLYQEHRFQNIHIILNAVDGSNSYHYSDSYGSSYPYGQAPKKMWLSRRVDKLAE